ncbi:MAG TPA: NADH:ubiquinone oxidoreductase [Mycobacteriales bacterium]|nr:NADH:ubiquinone oxidoreductase [Mycobacteriales bacterium]
MVTTRYPGRPDRYAASSTVVARPVGDATAGPDVAGLCPTGAITTDPGSPVRVDIGRCIACGRCVRARPDLFGWAPGSEVAQPVRDALVVPRRAETDDAVRAVRAELSARTRALGRSAHVRHVDAGSDGADEWEVLALLNPVYDVHRLGIFFTASPRHADILLVTGVGTHGMAGPLRRTLEGMPQPTVVIAAGVDAVSGGLLAPTYAVAGGIGDLVPVDVWVPGSPPTPFSLLHALLLAVGRLPGRTGAER